MTQAQETVITNGICVPRSEIQDDPMWQEMIELEETIKTRI
jgi:hypothetical protein